MDSPTFFMGFVSGFVLAGILGFFSQRIRLARVRMGAYRRPQSVAHQTNQTPQQVMRGSAAGALSCLGWTLAMLVVIGLFLTGVYLAFFA